MIHFGWELGTGRRVFVPRGHLAITGQTQASGKTTAIEALAIRSGLSCIAFESKKGESGFRLLDEQGQAAGCYWWPFSWKREPTKQQLKELGSELLAAGKKFPCQGLKIIDLSEQDQNTQELVLAAVMDWVARKCRSTITCMPEAWAFIPRRRRSRAKLAAEKLIRTGAAQENWLFLDSQDISSVDYDVLRQVHTWVFGVQRHLLEVKKTLDYIPLIGPRPRAAEVATLGIGEFFVCYQDSLFKAYAQPAWLGDVHAQAVARGEELASTGRAILRDLENARGA